MTQKNKWKAVFSKVSGIIFLALGAAFLAGAFLAYIQNVTTQILILAAVGMACLMIGIILLFLSFRILKKTEQKSED